MADTIRLGMLRHSRRTNQNGGESLNRRDLVTEVHEEKHPIDAGQRARKRTEY